jgi:hypothetical protein
VILTNAVVTFYYFLPDEIKIKVGLKDKFRDNVGFWFAGTVHSFAYLPENL